MVGLVAALPLLAALPLASALRIGGVQSPQADEIDEDGLNWTQLGEHCQKLRYEIQASLGVFVEDRSEDYLRLLQTDQSLESNKVANFAVGDVEVTVSHFFENMSWTDELRKKGMPVTLRQAEGGDETIAYVKHLIDSYDSNASMTVLLHGNAPELRETPEGLVDYISQIDPKMVNSYGGYASLSSPWHRKPNSSQHKLLEYRMDCGWRDDFWVKYLKKRWGFPEWGGFEGPDGRYCCSQFVLTREALRSYPKEFYYSMLERISKDQPWETTSWKTIAKSMAMLWHVIYTGRLEEYRYNYKKIAHCPPGGCMPKKKPHQ